MISVACNEQKQRIPKSLLPFDSRKTFVKLDMYKVIDLAFRLDLIYLIDLMVHIYLSNGTGNAIS